MNKNKIAKRLSKSKFERQFVTSRQAYSASYVILAENFVTFIYLSKFNQ